MKKINSISKIVEHPFNESIEPFNLSIIAIKLNRRIYYINSLFYQNVKIKGSDVYVADFNNKRKNIVRKVYNEIINQLTFGGLRESKISYNLSRFFQFVRWCDSKGIHNCLDDEMNCINAINLYNNHCWEQVSSGKTKESNITPKLLILISMLKSITNKELHENLPKVKVSIRDRELTEPPDDIHASENIQILHSIINGVYELVFNKKEYPYAWIVPGFLNIDKNTVWIFPVRSWCQTNLTDNGTTKQEKGYCGFNYKYGRIVTQKELGDIGITDREYQNLIIRRARLLLEKTNKNNEKLKSNQKKDFLRYAIASFAFLLIANTGMNPTQLLNIKWQGEYSLQKESIDFCLIKFRSHNKKVNFRITSKFIPLFKRYLQLRDYYLCGEKSEYLIPSFGEKYKSHENMDAISKTIRSLMTNIGYKNGLIVAREWRCLKAEWLINNADPSVAAKLLQNDEKTILNHYSSGTLTKQTEDISNFLSKLTDIKIITDSQYEISTSVGGCIEPHKPINISSEMIFKPDCKQPEGCLFCEKFSIHADENDLRKILSCKYCIENTRGLSKSYDHWHETYDHVIKRIDEILNLIVEINPNLVDQMEHDVYMEGNLDPYWEGKLDMLIYIGAITNER